MNLQSWIPFVFAAALVLVVPGPTIVLVLTQAGTHGRRSVFPLASGVVLGDFTAMTLSLLGLGALMRTSTTIFMIVKLLGAAYLVFLGLRLWWQSRRSSEDSEDQGDGSIDRLRTVSSKLPAPRFFRDAFLVTVFNPKSLVFFIAFFPQFLNPHSPALPQMIVFGATFLILAFTNAALYGFFASRAASLIRGRLFRKGVEHVGGGVLIGAGVFMAMLRRSA